MSPNPTAVIARAHKKHGLIIDKDTVGIFGHIASSLNREGKSSTHLANDTWTAAIALQNNMKDLSGTERASRHTRSKRDGCASEAPALLVLFSQCPVYHQFVKRRWA